MCTCCKIPTHWLYQRLFSWHSINWTLTMFQFCLLIEVNLNPSIALFFSPQTSTARLLDHLSGASSQWRHGTASSCRRGRGRAEGHESWVYSEMEWHPSSDWCRESSDKESTQGYNPSILWLQRVSQLRWGMTYYDGRFRHDGVSLSVWFAAIPCGLSKLLQNDFGFDENCIGLLDIFVRRLTTNSFLMTTKGWW